MEVIEAIHSRRSIRAYSRRVIEHELIEEVIWDAAQSPPPRQGQVPWTFNVVEGVDRIAGYGDMAKQYARDNHPDEPGWEWTERADFAVFWGAPAVIIHLGPGRRLLPGGHESGALRTREGPRHLLGRLTAVVAENPRGEGRTANPAGADARRGALSWLPRGYPRAAAARAPEDHLDRVTLSIYPHSLCDPWTLFAPSPLYSRFEPERADSGNLRP